jgi:eukaryotic-like serine/threonine-protein kinase
LPAELSAIVEKSLEKNPRDRFQTADEFRIALRELKLDKSSNHDSPTAPVVVAPLASMTPSRSFKHLDPAVLETARKRLAVYIGPMAKIIVDQAANHARSVEELYQTLATEIPSMQDREKFMRSRPL